MVLPTFHNCLGFPLSSLSESIRKKGFEKSMSEEHDKLLNALQQSGFTHIKEKSLHKALEILPPIIDTIDDIIHYQHRNLFESLQDASMKTRLAQPESNGIQNYYEFAFKYGPGMKRFGFRDHGITSALLLLLQAAYHEYLMTKLTKPSVKELKSLGLANENILAIRQIKKLCESYKNLVVEAAQAVSVHNISTRTWTDSDLDLVIAENDYKLTLHDFRIPEEVMPIAFLLSLVDTLQDWDRPCFSVPSSEAVTQYQTDQDISITVDDEHIYISFPNKKSHAVDPLAKLKEELKTKFEPNFIDDLIKERIWEGINICELTSEAEEIERPIKYKSLYLSSEKLKELLALKKRYDHFEYVEKLDVSKYGQFLRLVRDLGALANTNGGYFVVGINEETFDLVGVTAKSKIPSDDDLIQTAKLFYSREVNIIGGQRKVLTQEKGRKTFKNFHIFYVERNRGLIELTKDGGINETGEIIFKKSDIPIRQEGATRFANKAYVIERFKEAQLCKDEEMARSILGLNERGKLPAELYEGMIPKCLPGELPKPDFEKLIGREAEIREVVEMLDNPKIFILTIDGVGGSGKSALALEVARNIKDHGFKSQGSPVYLKSAFDGVVWVTAKTTKLTERGIATIFGSPVTLEILIDQIADTLNFPEIKELTFEEKKEGIIELLKMTAILIVIDNLETIPDSQKR